MNFGQIKMRENRICGVFMRLRLISPIIFYLNVQNNTVKNLNHSKLQNIKLKALISGMVFNLKRLKLKNIELKPL